MSFEAGSATSPSDLLDKLRVFAEANGWNINRHGNLGAGRELCMDKAGCFINFRSLINEALPVVHLGGSLYEYMRGQNSAGTGGGLRYALLFNGSTSYDSGDDWWRQPGAQYYLASSGNHKVFNTCQFLVNTSPSYWFFSLGNCIHIIIEYASGYFIQGMFGMMNKFGTWTGGSFYQASNNTALTAQNGSGQGFFRNRGLIFNNNSALGMVYVSGVDGFTGWRPNFGYNAETGIAMVFDSVGLYKGLTDLSPNAMNSLCPIYPITMYLNRNTNNNAATPFSPIGIIPDLFFINTRSLVPGTTYSIGSDTYYVFPFWNKLGTRVQQVDGNDYGSLGFALKSN